jgi:hypothetical protein
MTKLKSAIIRGILCALMLAAAGCGSNGAGSSDVSDSDTVDTAGTSDDTPFAGLPYAVVDTGQTFHYNDSSALSSAPAEGAEFYGQDAQYAGNARAYTLSADGKTVYDSVTGLTWQRSPNLTNTAPVYEDKMALAETASYAAALNAMAYGGYTDWRLPSVKELYSLILFVGTDPSGYTGTDTSVLTPFIDTDFFNFSYGDQAYERILDSQYFSTTTFINNPGDRGIQKQFGVNFADGRIKGYDISSGAGDKTFFVQCVRGNTSYGINAFADNGDGTVTDNATALMWSKGDSGIAMSWKEALSWVQTQNEAEYLGYNDWRLPDVKELNSIVDYSNAPEYNGKPAIDTDFFETTAIVNEEGEDDFAYFWSGTTHAAYLGASQSNVGSAASYIPFGRALGYHYDESGSLAWINVHGAGAQRSDPKNTDLSAYDLITVGVFSGYSHGPQGDAVRAVNFVRLVRDL